MGRHFQKPQTTHGGIDKLLEWADEADSFKEGRRFSCIRMLMLKGAETSVNEAAEVFGVNVRTVNQWLNQWNKDGKEGLKTKPRPGRPRKFNPEHEARVRELIDNQAEMGERLTIKGIHGFLKE